MRVRELREADYAGVVAVLGRNGLRAPTPEQWSYLAHATPHREMLGASPLGWVLDDDRQGIVGTFRNLPFLYEWNQRPVRIAIAHIISSCSAVGNAIERYCG